MRSIVRIVAIVAAAGAVTCLYTLVIPTPNHTTVALTLLLVPLVAGTSGLFHGILASVVCAFCFNFFFLPPVATLTIRDPENWMAFVVFLITALTANHLSSAAMRRAEESERNREEVSRLYQVSRAIIQASDPETAAGLLARQIKEAFGFSLCRIAVPDGTGSWTVVADTPGDAHRLEPPVPDRALNEISHAGHAVQTGDGAGGVMTCAPLRSGPVVAGVLICDSGKAEPATVDALAGLSALALERARFLREIGKTEALKQSDQLKSAILASVSHDLRTPLTSIMAAVDNLLSTDVEWNEDSKHEFYSIIKEEVERLSRLVQNLLEMARIEAGECRPVKDWGSVPDMISDVLARCVDSLVNHQVTLKIQENMPAVRWDERLMSQVLVCVLENAAKYSPAGTEIALGADLSVDTLRISVHDQGPGILAEEVPRIFDRFYRGKSGAKDGTGTGMGLAIARGIMAAHGGEIHVASEPGSGATFLMTMPVESRTNGDG
ncbi:MAG: DUF4118 domain-containing protein [Acidobacteria bacterium]|nr:DUF4118 domain-containing protein [Acidobacteriota bacterium]